MKFKTLLALLALALACAPLVHAQNAPPAEAVKSWTSKTTGSVTSAATFFTVATNDPQTMYFSFSSVGGGGVFTTETSFDNGATWIALPTSKLTNATVLPSTTWSPTTSDVWQADLSAGTLYRVRLSSYVSGTVTINANFRPFVVPTVQLVSGGTGVQVVGNVASGATDSGNPVKVGCVRTLSPPAPSNGQRVDCQASGQGFIIAATGNSQTTADGAANSSVVGPYAFNGPAVAMQVAGSNFNGSTWDRQFTCPSSAVINVSAAATTQLVALASSQIIRVCSFVISGDTLATTATFVYGTGSNCATGQVAITGAMRMVDEGNISLTGMNGSLFRTAASNALCLTAATGAVTGFVTYTQY